MRGEATNRAVLGRKTPRPPWTCDVPDAQRWERPGWQQTRRPEDDRM